MNESLRRAVKMRALGASSKDCESVSRFNVNGRSRDYRYNRVIELLELGFGHYAVDLATYKVENYLEELIALRKKGIPVSELIDLHRNLESLSRHKRILSKPSEWHMQSTCAESGFLLERRILDGLEPLQHYIIEASLKKYRGN